MSGQSAISRSGDRFPPRLHATYSVIALPVIALATFVAYVSLLGWPMRIWHRAVSPDVHLVGTLGISRSGAAVYIATVLVLFGLYLAALSIVLARRAHPRPWIVLAASTLFCVSLWATHPLTSTDVFNYIASARVLWVHGGNPLTVPPLAYPQDPFFRNLTFWQDIPSPYGPLWSILTAGPTLVGGDDPRRTILAFKAISIGFFLATGWLLYLIARRLRPDLGLLALLAYTWNPLVIIHVAGNGHNDSVMMFFVALFLYALSRGWVAASLIALAASALVKYASLLIVPLLVVWWLRSEERPSSGQWLAGIGGAAVLVVIAYAPFWSGAETVRTALNEGTYFAVSVPAAVRGALTRVVEPGRAEQATLILSRVLFLAVLTAVLVRLRGDALCNLIAAGFFAFFAYLCLAATYFSPWHVLWPLTFAVLLPYRRDVLWPALTLSLTALSVLMAAVWFRERFAPDPRADWYGMHLAAAVAVFPLPILIWLWAGRSMSRTAAPVHEGPTPGGERLPRSGHADRPAG